MTQAKNKTAIKTSDKTAAKAPKKSEEKAPVPDVAHKERIIGDDKTILDIPVKVRVEVGSREISFGELSRMSKGSVLELDGQAGDPMNVYANDKLVAKGEIVVVNDRFGIRLTEIG